MPVLKANNAPEELIHQLDVIYKEKGYDSRGELIIDVLTKYCAFGSSFFVTQLPETVQILTQNLLKEYPEMLKDLQLESLKVIEENTKVQNQMAAIFDPDMLES